jgi:hypothetical protein
MEMHIRKAARVTASVLLAAAGLITFTETADASTVPLGCSGATSESVTTGATVCWYGSTATAKICDTKADGLSAAILIKESTGAWVAASSDFNGSGGCVWGYPLAALYETNGDIVYRAATEDSEGYFPNSGPTVTSLW